MSEHSAQSTDVRVAIVGVGNCASSLVQGVQYYQDADDASTVPGLMHVRFGPYHVRDVKFVAAYDVDVTDLADAMSCCTIEDEDYFSYRRQGPDSGRMAALAVVRQL